MQAVLEGLALGHPHHVDAGRGAALGCEADDVRLLLDDAPPEHGGPEVGDGTGLDGVDDDDGESTGHALIVTFTRVLPAQSMRVCTT